MSDGYKRMMDGGWMDDSWTDDRWGDDRGWRVDPLE